MKRSLMLVLLLTPFAAMAQTQKVPDLLRTAEGLIKADKYQAAESCLLKARDLDPRSPDIYRELGYLYMTSGDRTQALDAYGQLLLLQPDDQYGRSAIKRLFYQGPFPRSLPAAYMPFSGVDFENDEVRLLTPAGEITRRLAYTTSMLFHEDMGLGQGPVEIPLPVSGGTFQVNRSTYGYVMAPGTDRYDLAFILSYPSATLSDGRDYSQISTHLTHFLLRFYWYARVYLDRGFPEGKVARVYLCNSGPAGAETYKNSIYFYDMGVNRSPVEWARQVAHEFGHLVLPQVGLFVHPEPYASGKLGESLFMQYLAQEAGLVAGQPWPSEAAQQAVDQLWPGKSLKLADYLTNTVRPRLDYWLAAGPDSPLAAGTGDEAMRYFVGFMLWVQAAHGTDTVRQVLASAKGSAPTDFIYALKTILRQEAAKGSLVVNAGSINLPVSHLTAKPLEGALGRTNVKLAPGDTAVYTVYLPAGSWHMTIEPASAGVSVTLDGKGPLPVDQSTGLSLGHLGEGWHSISLQMGQKGATITLDHLVFNNQSPAHHT